MLSTRRMLVLPSIVLIACGLVALGVGRTSSDGPRLPSETLTPVPSRPAPEGSEPDSDPPSPAAPTVGDVTGRILWPDGKPVERGLIRRLAPGDKAASPYHREEAQIRGGTARFHLPGASGPAFDLVLLQVIRGHRSHFIEFDELGRWPVSPGSRDLELQLETEPLRPLLTVQAIDPIGRPVRRGTLIVDPVGDFESGSLEFDFTGGEVRVRLPCLAERVILTVIDAIDVDGAPLGRQAAGPFPVALNPIRMELPKSWTLVGRVVTEDGLGVPDVGLNAVQPSPWFNFYGGYQLSDCVCGSIDTDKDGRFEIPHLAPGPATLVVGSLRRQYVLEGKLWLQPPSLLVHPDDNGVEIVLRPGVRPDLRVVDPDGTEVPRGAVRIRHEHETVASFRLEWRNGPADPLDPTGRYTLRIVQPEGARLPLEPRVIEGWSPAETTIVLQWALDRAVPEEAAESSEPPMRTMDIRSGDASLIVRVDPGPYGAMSDLCAEIVPDDGGTPRRVELSGSETTISGLAADQAYTLRILGGGVGLALEAKGLHPGSETHVLTLERGVAINGSIKLPPDTTDLSITANRGTFSTYCRNMLIIHRDGRFEIFGLIPGVWHAEFCVWAGGRFYMAELDLPAGGSPVVVTLEPMED